MPSLMSRQTFEALAAANRTLAIQKWSQPGHPASVFVPWAGKELIKKGGIYIVGIALAAEDNEERPLTYDESYAETKAFVYEHGGRHSRSHTPFWRFLDRLSLDLLGAAFDKTIDDWGWSNLLKIHWSEGTPASWPSDFVTSQLSICSRALREEFDGLENSLVYVASHGDFGLLHEVYPPDKWNKEYEQLDIWWLLDEKSKKLYVHGPHPYGFLQRFDVMVETVRTLAQMLPRFA